MSVDPKEDEEQRGNGQSAIDPLVLIHTDLALIHQQIGDIVKDVTLSVGTSIAVSKQIAHMERLLEDLSESISNIMRILKPKRRTK